MDSLSAALQRLFGRPGQPLPDPWPESGALLEPVDPDGRAWALVIGLPRPAGGAMEISASGRTGSHARSET